MQIHKLLKYLLFIVLISAAAPSAYSGNTSLLISKSGISQDSISKSEIADYRKRFEAVEKMIASRRGTYQDAQSQFNSIKGSRVRNLPEFAGRFSSMQSKLTAWNTEVNPKQPPVVVPNTPSNPPKNTGRTNEKNPVTEETKSLNTAERENLMLSYFPDTMTVGTDFLAYVEITGDNTVQFGNRTTNSNSAIDKIMIGSSSIGTSAMTSSVTVELSIDGGNQNFTINSRSDSKTKTISGTGSARWEWILSPNAEGDARVRLSVKYQKQGADGLTSEVPAISKIFIIKALPKKGNESPNYLPWIIVGVILLLALIGYLISQSRKNRNRDRHNNRHDDDRRSDDRHIIQR